MSTSTSHNSFNQVPIHIPSHVSTFSVSISPSDSFVSLRSLTLSFTHPTCFSEPETSFPSKHVSLPVSTFQLVVVPISSYSFHSSSLALLGAPKSTVTTHLMTTRSKVGIFKPKTHTTNLSYPSHVHSPSTPLDNHECQLHSPSALSSQSSMHINKSKSFFLSMCVTKP